MMWVTSVGASVILAMGGSSESGFVSTGEAGTFDSAASVYVPRSIQCVLFDTRVGQGGTGPIPGNGTKTFSLTGDVTVQGGDAGCTVPAFADGFHLNLVAVAPSGSGNLKAWPFSLAEPNGGQVNYSATSTMNNSNAFMLRNDSVGITVRANGASVEVRAVLIGFLEDGGDYYADVGHDHAIAQVEGAIGSPSGDATWTTIQSISLDIQDECSFLFFETHKVVVRATGYVSENDDISVEFQLAVSDPQSPVAATAKEIRLEDAGSPTVVQELPFALEYVFDVGSGSQTFYLVGKESSVVSTATGVNGLIMVAEQRGWECTSIPI